MTRALSQDLLWYGYWKRKMVTITVIPTPSDATVTLTSAGYVQSGNSITLPIGATLNWSVAKTPTYNTKSGQFVVSGPDTLSIELSSAPTGTLTITPVPSGSVVTLTCPGVTQVGNAITAPLGSIVHCTVSPNNGVDLLSASTDIQINQTSQTATLTCNARVTIVANPSDSGTVANITYAGRTYSETTIVPYDSRISWSVSHVNYDSQSAQNVQILENTTISVTLQKTMVVFSVTPYINGTYAPTATVQLSTNASGISPVSGQGTQQIEIPIGSSVTYTVSQANYDSVTDVVENITSATNITVSLSAHAMGIKFFTTNTSWTVPTSDSYKAAIITNAGRGGSSYSAKQFGGLGGGASGNAYIVDMNNLVAGQILAFDFGTSNTIITKNGSDYLTYPNGANGADSSASSVNFNGTNGGAAISGNGGGGGSGGCRHYVESGERWVCVGVGRQATCHWVPYSTTFRGVISNSGEGGANGNSGVTPSASTVISSTYSNGGSGGAGFNTATGGAGNSVAYSSPVEISKAGVGGIGGTGASFSQSSIEAKIQNNTLTSSYLRSLIKAGSGGTGGVLGTDGDFANNTPIATPGAGGGGGAWTNGSAGANGVANTTGSAFANVVGGNGGHGVIIIWRPSDYA